MHISRNTPFRLSGTMRYLCVTIPNRTQGGGLGVD